MSSGAEGGRSVDAGDEWPRYVEETGEVVSMVPEAKRCVAYGPGLGGGAAGEAQHFALILSDEQGGKLRNFRGGSMIKLDIHQVINSQVMPPLERHSNSEFKYSVIDLKDGTYSISYYIARVGEFQLHLRLDGEDVAGSPFRVKMRPGKANSAASQVSFDRKCKVLPGSLVETEPINGKVAIESEVKIATCDALGNRTYSAKAAVAARGGGGVKIKDVVDFQDGNFAAFLEISGDGRLDVLVEGIHVRGSPFTVRVPFARTPVVVPGQANRGMIGNFQEVLLAEREEALDEGERRLAALRREVDARFKKFPIAQDLEGVSVPPQAAVTVPAPFAAEPPRLAAFAGTSDETGGRKSSDFVREIETRLATLRAKEEEVERLLTEVNREKVETEDRKYQERAITGGVAEEEMRRLRAVYGRKDEWLERRREEVEQLVKRRTKEQSLEEWSVDETMNKVGFMKQSRIRMEKEQDAASKVKYTVDWLYAKFASSAKLGISMTDAVSLVHKAKLPMDSAEVVDAFIDFIKETPSERVVSREKLLTFLGVLANLTYRDQRDLPDQLASLFEEFIFPLVIHS